MKCIILPESLHSVMGRIPVCRCPLAGLFVGVLMASVSSLSDANIVTSASLSSCDTSCFTKALALAAENELMYVDNAADAVTAVLFDSNEFVTVGSDVTVEV